MTWLNSIVSIQSLREVLKRKNPLAFILLILAIFLLVENSLLAVNFTRDQKTIVGLRLYGKNIGGLGKAELKKFIQEQIKNRADSLTLTYDGVYFWLTTREVGATFKADEVVAALLAIGKRGGLFYKVLEQNKAALGFADQKIKSSLSKSLLLDRIATIAAQVNKAPIPPMPDFINDLNKTLPPKDGVAVDANKLTNIIAFNIFNPTERTLAIPVIPVFQNHGADELNEIRKSVPDLVDTPIQISSAGQIFTLNRKDLLSMLKVVERPNPKNHQKNILVLRLDETKLNQKLGEFAAKVENITHAEFAYHEARVAIYSQFYSGTRNLIPIPTGGLEKELADIPQAPTSPQLAAASIVLDASLKNNPAEKFVYLTFDDGPNNLYHPLVLDILKHYAVKATFFLVGRNSQKFESITKRTVEEGHVIGDHSLTHAFLPKLSPDAILNEIKAAKEILDPFYGTAGINLFRPPYGGVNKIVRSDARDLNLKLFLWDVDPRDWSEPSTDELVDRVISHAHSGADILLHSNHLSTVKALPKIIEKLKELGYNFKKLDSF